MPSFWEYKAISMARHATSSWHLYKIHFEKRHVKQPICANSVWPLNQFWGWITNVSFKNSGAGGGTWTHEGLRQRILSPPPYLRQSLFSGRLFRPGSDTPAPAPIQSTLYCLSFLHGFAATSWMASRGQHNVIFCCEALYFASWGTRLTKASVCFWKRIRYILRWRQRNTKTEAYGAKKRGVLTRLALIFLSASKWVLTKLHLTLVFAFKMYNRRIIDASVDASSSIRSTCAQTNKPKHKTHKQLSLFPPTQTSKPR